MEHWNSKGLRIRLGPLLISSQCSLFTPLKKSENIWCSDILQEEGQKGKYESWFAAAFFISKGDPIWKNNLGSNQLHNNTSMPFCFLWQCMVMQKTTKANCSCNGNT